MSLSAVALATLLMPEPAIHVNQAGYLPSAAKIAVVVGEPSGDATLLRGDETVATLTIGDPVVCSASGDTVRWIDFTQITEGDELRLVVPGVGTSPPFSIRDDVVRRPLRLAMLSYTGLRSGTAVDLGPEFPEYVRPAGHTAPSRFHESSGREGTRDLAGGWYDAGDFGKYIVNSGITTGTLLLAFERNSEKLASLPIGVPEAGGALPEFLAEVKWNLDWMLKMQDEIDGGVWHKNTKAAFGGFVMPHEDTGETLIVGTGVAPFKGTAATADFAAVMAIASRVFEPYDEVYAAQTLAAARNAFDWAVANPDSTYTDQPEGISTGAYGDGNVGDEILWAAGELFRTTGEHRYDREFQARAGDYRTTADSAPAWPQVADLGLFAYAQAEGADADLAERIRSDAIRAADGIAARIAAHPYRMPLLDDQFVWGSNGVVGNYALMLAVAHDWSPKRAYRDGMADSLGYLFGRNPFGVSFLTHVGTRWAQNIHHRPSGADDVAEPWPGLLSGGPNSRWVEGVPPMRAWLEEQSSYATNENAINWNAPLVFVLAELL